MAGGSTAAATDTRRWDATSINQHQDGSVPGLLDQVLELPFIGGMRGLQFSGQSGHGLQQRQGVGNLGGVVDVLGECAAGFKRGGVG